MRYRLYNTGRRLSSVPATVWSRDGQVVDATPAFAWAIGKAVEHVLWWAWDHGFTVVLDSPVCRRGLTEPQEAAKAFRLTPYN